MVRSRECNGTYLEGDYRRDCEPDGVRVMGMCMWISMEDVTDSLTHKK